MPNDVNLVLGRTATASSSVAPYTPDKAINGNKTSPSNRWLSVKSPGWLCVNLQGLYAISRWAAYLLPNATPTWPVAKYGMQKYSLQVSNDGTNWATADSVTGNGANFTDRTLATVATGRYVRIYTDGGLTGNPQAISLLEFEAYGSFVGADLSSLVLNSGALVPAFSSSNLAYTQLVNFDTASVTLTPTSVDPSAVITVNGIRVASGQASAPINLVTGANTINVVVTPPSGAAKTYSVVVTRPDSPYLTALAVQSRNSAVALSPSFAKTTQGYTASVGSDTTTVTVTPTAESPNATIKVNGAVVASGGVSGPITLSVGSNNIITVVVTTASGASQSYTITVTKAESAYLSALTVQSRSGAIPLSPAFVKTTASYTASVASGVTNATVTPTAENSTETIKVNGTVVASGGVSGPITLNVGSNTITVVVTTPSGALQTYTITVTRAAS